MMLRISKLLCACSCVGENMKEITISQSKNSTNRNISIDDETGESKSFNWKLAFSFNLSRTFQSIH